MFWEHPTSLCTQYELIFKKNLTKPGFEMLEKSKTIANCFIFCPMLLWVCLILKEEFY